MRTYVVVGGAGFLGSHMCDLLIARGDAVVCVDNLITGARWNIEQLAGHERFSFIATDVSQSLEVEEPIDVVMNLASPASLKDYFRWPIETLDVASLGTRNCIELALRNDAHMFMASTSGVYGDPKVHPQTEDYWGNVNPIGVRSVYDEAKRFSEALVMAFVREHGLKGPSARIFNTYGPRMAPDDGRVVSNFVVQALRGEPITVYGDGSQTRSFCYVADAVDGLLRLDDSQVAGPINIGNPNEFTISERADHVLAITESASSLVFEPLPSDDPLQRQPDITRARTELGWEPTVQLAEGLAHTIDYFRSIGIGS
jgi:nucleoside-diphosphate-sugar epimerase